MNTTETNKKLAEFLGRNYADDMEEIWFELEASGHRNREVLNYSENYKHYHNDWNWLMLVVEKIKESCWMDILIGTSTTVEIGEYEQQEPNIASHNAKEMVEAVYNACSMFVDWYNNQKP